MDVIINNPASQSQFTQPQVQYAPVTQTPSGYGPGYSEYRDHHGGPGFLLPLLLIGGFLFFRSRNKRRRQMMRRWQGAGGPGMPETQPGTPDFVDNIRENFRRGRQRFMSDGAIEIARERYARGEINADEYQAIAGALSGEQAFRSRVNMDKNTPPDII